MFMGVPGRYEFMLFMILLVAHRQDSCLSKKASISKME
jgi:hypothetical protein